MIGNNTKGGLQAAYIENRATSNKVYCMFNPFEYTITKSNSYKPNPSKGKNAPKAEFTEGGKQVLKLTLHFDTQQEGTDVRDLTDPLWDMMMVVEKTENPRSGKSSPPEVAFSWGKLYFKAFITSLSQKFTLFKGDGTPIRCTLDITLEQFTDVNDYRDQVEGIENITQSPQTVTVMGGDRPDNIAAKGKGVASAMREIAEANNIDDLLHMRAGITIHI